MSKESAMNLAVTTNPQVAEVKVSPVTGDIPANSSPNPAVDNGGVVPPSLASTQLSHLAKKEQKLLAEREAFKKEQEEFKALQTKVKEVYDKANAFEETRKKDPIKAMKDLGFTEQEIIDYLSQEEAPKPSTEQIVQAELKKFQDEQAKKEADARAASDQVMVTKFKGQLSDVIKSNPDQYELCAFNGQAAEDIMFGIAVEEAKAGQVPDVKSIADEVENYFYEQKLSMDKLKKFAPKEVPVAAPVIERSRVVHPPQDVAVKAKATTISNRLAPTVAAAAKTASRPETREEKRARLEALVRNGLTR